MDKPVTIPEAVTRNWQGIVDILAEITGIPAALIMRVDDPAIEVFLASDSPANPYHAGDREHLWESGLYCETVIKTQDKLMVPNALEDPDWADNPNTKLNMIAYLGYPLLYPDRQPFGTLCILDKKQTRSRRPPNNSCFASKNFWKAISLCCTGTKPWETRIKI